MAGRRRFLRPVLWSAAVLAGGGVLFAAVLAADIPYVDTTPAPTTAPMASAATSAAAAVESPWRTRTVEATGLREGADDRTLLIQVRIPEGSPDCARDPRIEGLTEENGIIYAGTVISGLTGADCRSTAPTEIRLTATSPIANRTVVLNSQTTAAWHKLPDGTWGHCGALGCDPPADHCAPVRVAQTYGEAIDTDTRACDQEWLVVDRVNFHRSPSIRVLYRWAPEGWQPVMNVESAGCDEILAKEPRFTRALCEKLGPIS
ncbi:hypothetical protein [Amycolatopsis orientalis]|uniref:hypothetical protein n=1 Tax=Amycolatopsis orientalis TaxID=31958 RepID=UPI0012689AB3|nr:hypothetical protein [Amycolatopsis orientalis]